jgi:subtilisin-like proprotein convertase family protein
MRTGSSDTLFNGRRGRSRTVQPRKNTRMARHRWIDVEGLEARTLLATIPAPAPTLVDGTPLGPVSLTGLTSVTSGGDTYSPAVAIDPYDSQKVFAVWGLDLSQLNPPPLGPPLQIIQGAYSADGGTNWSGIGLVSNPTLDPLTVNDAIPETYVDANDPSVGWDAAGNVYVLALQSSSTSDGALILSKYNFSGSTPTNVSLPNQGVIYQWVTGSDAATSPALAVDAGTHPSSVSSPPAGIPNDPDVNNVYIAWASIDTQHATPLPDFNPDRAELIVGTPNSTGNGESMAFSAVTTVNLDGNFGPQQDTHPKLVIDPGDSSDPGQVTIGWEDDGTGATVSPPITLLMSNIVEPGQAFGFSGSTGTIATAIPPPSGSSVDTPVTTPFGDSVDVPDPGAIDALTVTIDLIDAESVANLSLVLSAPDGQSITLVANQNNAAGQADAGIGLPTGNAIGVFGYAPGSTNGTTVGTIFDDNGGRNIFDPTPTGTNGNSAVDYIGFFRPEFGSLDSFVQTQALFNDINGPWTLSVTNFTSTVNTSTGIQGEVEKFSLQFSTGMTLPTTPTVMADQFEYFYGSNPSPFLTDVVGGSLTDTYADTPAPATAQGVGPGLAMAEDNTLGPFSPYQGRIYATFVGYFDVTNAGVTNPRTDTDIFLISSDNGGETWSSPVLVDADQATSDGFSADNDSIFPNSNNIVTGRTKFQPEIAVDQSTGTVVISWRDASYDAGNARVATFLTTSINGGATFGPQSYANPSKTAVDAITGATNIIGPAPDDESAGNPQTDPQFGFGNQMGLAVADGQVFPVWAGNFNGPNGDPNDSYYNGTTVVAYPLNIWYQPMTIAAGPRIISSTMGAVVDTTLTGSAVDLPQFIPPAETPSLTPTLSAIPITGDPSLNISSLEVTIGSLIYPSDGQLTIKLIAPNGDVVILYEKSGDKGQSFSGTTFSDSATESLAEGSAPYSGTFLPFQSLSSLNGMRAIGNWSLVVDGGIGPNGGILQSWSISINGVASKPTAFEVTFDRAVDPQALINENEETFTAADVEVFYHDTTSGDASIPLLVTSVAPLPPPYYVTDPTQNGVDGYTNFVVTFNPDELPNGSPSGITDFTGTYSYAILPDNGQGATPTVISSPIWSFNTVPAPQPVITPLTDPAAKVSPDLPIASFGPGGSGTNFDETQSNITLTGFNNQTISGLTVNVNIADPTNGLGEIGDLFLELIAPSGTGIVLYYKPGDANKNLTNVTFSDHGAQSIEVANGPYTNGTFQSYNPLALLDGGPVNGTYTLVIDNYSSINIGTLLNWSITVNSTKLTTEFLSGAGMDQNADGTSDENPVTSPYTGLSPGDAYMAPMPQTAVPFTFNSNNLFDPPFNQNSLPLIMPGPYVTSTSVPGGSGSENLVVDGTASSLNVTFDRPIQVATVTPGQVLSIMGPVGPISGPQDFSSDSTLQTIPEATASGPAVLSSTATVPSFGGTFTISHISVQLNVAFTDDADLSAVLIAPDGTQVPLFSGVGGTGGNFINTTFDDSAETPIASGTAPFTGSYQPTGMLSSLNGHTVDIKNSAGLWVPGVWTLQITNTSTGTTGTLENWSMSITPVISVAAVSPSSAANLLIPAESASGPGVLNSQVVIPSSVLGIVDSSLQVQLSISNPNDSNLSAVLIAPDGTQVTLFAAGTLAGANLTNTIFSAGSSTPITSGTAPYTGMFEAENPGGLSALLGKSLAGTWTLKVTDDATGAASTLESWSLVTASSGTFAAQVANTFKISFPQQDLSGTYTLQMGADVSTNLFPLDQAGDAVNSSLDAGLSVLRGGTSSSPVSTVNYPSSDLPKTIPAPGAGSTTPGEVTSTIIVPDSFVVLGDTTSSGISGLRVTLSLTYPSDPDLVLTLQHYDLSGDLLASVTLASNVGGSASAANFTNTTFDDRATTPIEDGGAPFFGTFNPQIPLSDFAGLNAQGTWVLVVQNSSTLGNTGILDSWSLSFQKAVPSSDLGVPGADDINASFRLFNLGQADAMSAEAWTPVGAASNNAGAGVTTASTTATSGRVTGLAVDLSDPTGNTVFAAGATGGVWKTTDFLTTNPGGPTWISLTDFGPSNAVNIGSITLFERNNNTSQTIVIAATGESDTTPVTPGVGFLISYNGGSTWTLDDSSVNVDSSGNPLPIETNVPSLERNRVFVGDTINQVVVDPKLTATGGVIIYAALTGPTGGIWRSLDTGAHWTQMFSGQASSVVLDEDSGAVTNSATGTTSQGNLQIVYAGIEGVGVEMSPNQGQVWNLMTGGEGNPLIVNDFNGTNVNPAAPPKTPNGPEGQIVLTVPAVTGLAAEDPIYEGWLYAAVAAPSGAFYGLFETKDFGENWTQVMVATVDQAIPTNNVLSPEYQITGTGEFTAQGNNTLTLAVDPVDPSVVYLGGSSTYLNGTAVPNETALARIDTTNIWDAHSLVAYSDLSADGGLINLNSAGPATINTPVVAPPYFLNEVEGVADTTPYENFIRSPQEPFLANARLDVYDYATFTNSGAGVTWIPFDPGGTDYHSVTTMIDPLTGLPRLILGNDQGVWTVLDNNGTFETQVGASSSGVQLGSATDPLANVDRNGDLQITQFYYGAVQPSTAAAEIADALFYGSSQDNGGPVSDPNIITDGNITYFQAGSDATADAMGVGTDQQGLGTAYQFFSPCCGGNDIDFFQYMGPGLSGTGLTGAGQAGGGYVGRTFGLLQASNGLPTPDPQWPYGGGANFAVNPVDSAEVVISSNVGRIFVTQNGGVTWFDIGDPTVFGSPNGYSVALAYGAPDPSAPEGVGTLGNFIYVGTQGGEVYVTQDGGGNGTSNDWINISAGLDGSPVESIIADPIRGSHDAYAVTTTGVFYMADSIPSATNTPAWVNITGNIKSLAYSIFGQSYDPTTDGNSTTYNQAIALSSIVADWRYQIPFNPTDPLDGTHPVLYVGSGGSGSNGSGVYQSLDNGTTWTLFPSTTYGAVASGGDLPHVAVTDLDTSLGNINANTGMPLLAGPLQAIVFAGTLSSGSTTVTAVNPISALVPGDTISGNGIASGTTILSINTSALTITLSEEASATGTTTLAAADPTVTADPDLLLATTWGRGQFAINLSPLIVGNTVSISPTAPGTPPYVGTPITISGSSEISSFGNTTWITVEDVTNPANPIYITGYNPADPVPVPSSSNSTNSNGNFTFNFNPAQFYGTSYGVKSIEVFATDDAGSVGNKVITPFDWDPATQLMFSPTGEPPATAEPGANFAASPAPVVVDADDAAGNIATTYNGPVTISLAAGATGLAGTDTVDAVAGVATFTNLSIGTDGTYKLLGSSPGLTTTSPPSTPIVIVGAATQLYIIQEPPTPVQAGTDFQFSVGADDSFGNPTTIFPANATMTVAMASNPGSSNPNGVSETVPVVDGVATFTDLTLNKVGVGYTLKVTSGTLTSITTNPITVTNAPAVQLVISPSGEPPAALIAGQTFGMTVTALDPFGNVDLGYSGQVTLSIASGVFTGTTTLPAVNGVAVFQGLAIDTTGTYKIQATSVPALASATSTSVVVTPAAPAQLLWQAEPPTSIVHNYPFGAALEVEDQYGNLETSLDETVSIALDHNPNGASLNGTAFAALLSGVASFSTLSINSVGSGYTLQATAGTLTSLPSTPIDVTPTPAASLEISVEPPTNVTVYTPFSFQVTALDQFGNPDSDFDGTVTVELASGATSTLHGTLTETANLGVATFSDLSVDTVGSGYTLAVTSTGLVGATSNSFTANPGAAASLIVTTEPASSVAAGSQFGFVVTAEDAHGNLATSFNGVESIALATAPSPLAVLTGANSVTAVNGVATVSDLILTTAGSNYSLQISGTGLNSGLTSATTTAFTVTPLAASKFVISSEPPANVTAGSPFGLTITAEDPYGNQATTFNGTVVLSLSHDPGTGVLGGTQTSQAASGVAQFSGLVLDTAGSGYTVAASNGVLTSAPSTPITVNPATATTLTVYIPPPTTMTSGSQFGLAIAALDQFGNLATGYTGKVTIALENNPGNAILSGPVTVAAVGGVANFHAFITTEKADSGYTLQATAPPLSPVTTGPITVIPAPATHLVLISEPPTIATPGSSFGFIVAAEDTFGNISASYSGQIFVAVPTGSGATLQGTTSLTPVNGEVTFSGLTLTETNGAVPLSVTSTGLTSVTTTSVAVTTPAQLAFATGSVTVNDDAGTASIQVVRSGGYAGPVSVTVATSNGTAVAGVNYTAVSQVLNFASGQNSQTVTVPITNTGTLSTGLTVNIGLFSPGTNATIGTQSTAAIVIQSLNTAPPPPPLVTLESVTTVTNKKHQVKQIQVGFSGALNSSEAASKAIYELIMANKKGVFLPAKKNLIKIKSAAYSADTVTLTLKTPARLTKAIELIVQGTPPAGLQDAEGRYIDGNDNGMAGSNAVAVISKGGVTIDAALPRGPMAVKRAVRHK